MRKVMAFSLVVFLAGCDIQDLLNSLLNPANPEAQVAELAKFQSAQEFLEFLDEQLTAEQNAWRDDVFTMPGFGLGPPIPLAEEAGDAAGAPPADGDNGQDFSTTNVQEAGVDESDVVKNDGTYLYVLHDETVHILRAVPAEQLTELATVELDGYGDSLYLFGDTLVALYRPTGEFDSYPDEEFVTANIALYPYPYDPQTGVAVIDVSDRSAPTVTANLTFEGNYATSRMIENKLHLVLTMYPIRVMDWSEFDPATADVDSVIPNYRMESGGQVVEGNVAGWEDFYHPLDPDGYGITTVLTIDVDNPQQDLESVAIMADAGTVYASTSALYVTDTEYDYTGGVRENTDIYKFDLTGDVPQYVAAGTVPGRFLNQFSLGEYEGYLRTATTVSSFDEFGFPGPQSTSSNVYVLGQEGEELNIVGSVENIAPGETIFAARFLGNRGFLVTFEKIDPLFTIDLSDPTNPRIAGELKIPGFSDYIHLMDENHLLTLGKDADPQDNFSWFQGVQLSIFDVSDFANPVRTHNIIIGDRGTESEASYNHKAFNYFPARDLLAIPIDLYEGGGGGPTMGEFKDSGIYVYRVTADEGFDYQGYISTVPDDAEPYFYYWSGWQRGIFIGDYLYAANSTTVRSKPLQDLAIDATLLQFAEEESPFWPPIGIDFAEEGSAPGG